MLRLNDFATLILLLALALVLGCLTTSAAWAQNSTDEVHVNPRAEPPAVKDQNFVDPSVKTHGKPMKVDVDLVLVPVTITDPMNRLVTGLDKENFSLFEGKEAQSIKTFSSEDAPVSLGVIFDMSGSMSSKIERAREAVVEFFKTANPQDEFFMITFADKPEEIADFTQSVEEIQGKLVYTVPKGRTALLTESSELTGGRTFTIDNPNDLADVATKIGIELRNQYVLGYRPKNGTRDGKWRKIKVKLIPPKGLPPLRVYAKTGYYAPTE